MLNLQIVSFQEELCKNNSKTFQTDVFKGHTDNAFVFLCKGLWQHLCSSIFYLCILSALTFYCSCCGYFVGACFIYLFRVFGGFYLKWLKINSLQYCFVFFVSPQRPISQRNFLTFLSICIWNACVHVCSTFAFHWENICLFTNVM